MNISATELRARTKECLDAVSQGEQVAVIRNSTIIAILVHPDQAIKAVQANERSESKWSFRQFGAYEDPHKLQEFYNDVADQPFAERLQGHAAQFYETRMGECWVYELDGRVAAVGCFGVNDNFTDTDLYVWTIDATAEVDDLRSALTTHLHARIGQTKELS